MKLTTKMIPRKIVKKITKKRSRKNPTLTWDRIDELATSSPKINKIAVENFLGTIKQTKRLDHALMNLDADARGYRWNLPTKNAIRIGIIEHFRS
jgi:hypothetical protein